MKCDAYFLHGAHPTQTLEDYFISTVFFSTVLTISCVLIHLAFLKIFRRVMDARLARQYQLDLRAHARDTFNDHVGGSVKLRLMVKGTTLKVSHGRLVFTSRDMCLLLLSARV